MVKETHKTPARPFFLPPKQDFFSLRCWNLQMVALSTTDISSVLLLTWIFGRFPENSNTLSWLLKAISLEWTTRVAFFLLELGQNVPGRPESSIQITLRRPDLIKLASRLKSHRHVTCNVKLRSYFYLALCFKLTNAVMYMIQRVLSRGWICNTKKSYLSETLMGAKTKYFSIRADFDESDGGVLDSRAMIISAQGRRWSLHVSTSTNANF